MTVFPPIDPATAESVGWAAFILAAIPAALTLWNHLVFRKPRPPETAVPAPEISILIPARNEERNIRTAIEAALRAEQATVEVVVLDDHSTDGTPSIVRSLADRDRRVRLETAPPLPPGWCGKQHACARLAEHARYDLMLFVDADVTMMPRAPRALAGFLERSRSSLVSAFPHQKTGTLLEKLLIPLIEFILLGYLPVQMGRWFRLSGFGAGCGQVFLAKKSDYVAAGGHGAVRGTLHDGVKLPRAFRKAGFRTDLCSGVDLFTCRMYRGGREVWDGLLKNAHEGIGHPASILPFTALLFGGSVLPFLLPVTGFPSVPAAAAAMLALLPRFVNALRFRQSLLGVILHPVSILLFLLIQWQALFRLLAGKKPSWRGRSVG